MENQPVSFPEWKTVLSEAALPPGTKSAYEREIISFLKHCKTSRAPATVALVKQYLAARESVAVGPMREALRWFFRMAGAARSGTAPVHGAAKLAKRHREFVPRVRESGQSGLRPMEPPPAVKDLGGEAWERELIKASRVRGFLWRTEETYRSWGRRFADFIAPKTPFAAGPEEVGAFLTDLAVRTRASASSQRQALNALVFLMQEALKRDLGKLDFKRAVQRERVPTVLTPEECRRLFNELEGTTRLMAELAYGSGIRLMELLRLRVQHVDLERRQLTVRGGKGDRVNGFADATGNSPA